MRQRPLWWRGPPSTWGGPLEVSCGAGGQPVPNRSESPVEGQAWWRIGSWRGGAAAGGGGAAAPPRGGGGGAGGGGGGGGPGPARGAGGRGGETPRPPRRYL